MLPALHFAPVVLPVAAALAAVADFASAPDALVLIVFRDGDVGDDGPVEVGRASNAWPNGARPRSLPLLPALRLTGVRDRSRREIAAAAQSVLVALHLQRRFAHDALILRADGATSALFWTLTSVGREHGASFDPPRWS
jgi:hypothetical protein